MGFPSNDAPLAECAAATAMPNWPALGPHRSVTAALTAAHIVKAADTWPYHAKSGQTPIERYT